MKIDDSHNPKGTSSRISRRPDPAGGKPLNRPRPSKDQSNDQVHLSPRAQEYQKVRQMLAALPDLDADKIQEIKDRIQSGRYRIDTDTIAEKMIKDALSSDD